MRRYIVFFAFMSCVSAPDVQQMPPGYFFAKPDDRIVLSSELVEVSGVVIKNNAALFCVQDELGVVYELSAPDYKIKSQTSFAAPGDFEGLAISSDKIWALRSDGMLYSYVIEKPSEVDSVELHIPADNNEGLCYDAANSRLLIGCKSRIGKGKENKDLRYVYAYDLTTKTLQDTPAFVFHVGDVQKMILAEQLDVPSRQRKNEEVPIVKFRISAIGIHPVTQQLYVLSAADHMLFIYSRDGMLMEVELLDEKFYNKAEGIAFYPNGDLLITNEGQDGKPTLVRLDYRD
jgi:uncharacterized protein YjiK